MHEEDRPAPGARGGRPCVGLPRLPLSPSLAVGTRLLSLHLLVTGPLQQLCSLALGYPVGVSGCGETWASRTLPRGGAYPPLSRGATGPLYSRGPVPGSWEAPGPRPRDHGRLTETTSAMQRLRLPLSSLMVMGLSSLILSMASGQSSWEGHGGVGRALLSSTHAAPLPPSRGTHAELAAEFVNGADLGALDLPEGGFVLNQEAGAGCSVPREGRPRAQHGSLGVPAGRELGPAAPGCQACTGQCGPQPSAGQRPSSALCLPPGPRWSSEQRPHGPAAPGGAGSTSQPCPHSPSSSEALTLTRTLHPGEQAGGQGGRCISPCGHCRKARTSGR